MFCIQNARRTGIPLGRRYKVVIMTEDLRRMRMFKEFCSRYEEYIGYSCWGAAEAVYQDKTILLLCHGVGSTACMVAMQELEQTGVDYVINIGSCGSYKQEEYRIGDLCAIYGTIRFISEARSDSHLAYPASAHPTVTEALVASAAKFKRTCHLGLSLATDLFYTKNSMSHNKLSDWVRANITVFEMECAAVFTMGNLSGIKTGAICAIRQSSISVESGKNEESKDDEYLQSEFALLEVALDAAVALLNEEI